MTARLPEPPPPRPDGLRVRLRRWVDNRQFELITLGIVLAFLLLYLSPHMIFTVGAGHGGVKFRRFNGGVVTDRVWCEGLAIIAPWDTLTIYDLRVQEMRLSVNALSFDGMRVIVDVSARYHPLKDAAQGQPESDAPNDCSRRVGLAALHQSVGPTYPQVLVEPEIINVIREVSGMMPYEALYENGSLLQQAVRDAIRELKDEHVTVDDIVVLKVTLPDTIEAAVERKLMLEQVVAQYDYVLVAEEKERQRKRIEAAGIHEAQVLVGEGISEALLRWRGIEATLELARSPNAKVVVVGGAGGLPLILDTNSAEGLVATGAPETSSSLTRDLSASLAEEQRALLRATLQGAPLDPNSADEVGVPAEPVEDGGEPSGDDADARAQESLQQ